MDLVLKAYTYFIKGFYFSFLRYINIVLHVCMLTDIYLYM